MLQKPYYRVYRPFGKQIIRPEDYDYLNDKKFCDYKADLIRYYRILENEVKTILNYVEPNEASMKVYSLKIYQILTSICIEIENNFKGILREEENKNLNMKDYFQTNKYLKLDQYTVQLEGYTERLSIKPFENWKDSSCKKLEWYSAYNSVKHSRTVRMKNANLKNLLEAIAALFVLLYAQFGLYSNSTHTDNMSLIEYFNEDGSTGFRVQQNYESILFIINEPKWTEDEKYDFDWKKLKNKETPFETINL